MIFKNYVQPETVSEALSLAKQSGTVILGGMMWLNLQKRTVETAVDLSRLGLDRIESTPDSIRIGAYVTLRQAETDPTLLDYTRGAVGKALAPIVGVQFRNTATVGGSVFGRFGFSDPTTLFTALGASVVLAEKGVIPMETFIKEGAPRDLLTHILLPKEKPDAVAVFAQRNSATDFPALTSAFCLRGENLRVTVSPAPVRGETREFPFSDAEKIPEALVNGLKFDSNRLASAAYRARLTGVFASRAIEEMKKGV